MPIQSQEMNSTIKGLWQVVGIGLNNPYIANKTYRLHTIQPADVKEGMWFVYAGSNFTQSRIVEKLAQTVCVTSGSTIGFTPPTDYVDILARSFCEAFNMQATPREKLPEPLRSAPHIWGFSAATLEIAQ